VRTSNLKANIHIVPFLFAKNSYFKFLKGSEWRRYVGEVGKFYHTLSLANVSKILHINLYHNRSSIVDVTTKNFGEFYAA